MNLDVQFSGLAAPLRLIGAEGLLPVLADVASGWPREVNRANPLVRPFFSITGQPATGQFRCETHVEDRPARSMDAVNALCDAIAALAMALPAEDDRLICLHAAGVVMGGRVVAFPNVRRAGKSTLSAALARAGHPVFSDDVLPVRFPGGRFALVEAMGIAPRLRLPLPDALPDAFRDWAASVAGPENRQYRYLSLTHGPTRGESLPVGAFVLLDRRDEPVPARLEPVPSDAAMDALLHQHFTRDRHSGDVLDVMAATLTGPTVWQLTYSGVDAAVACLRETFATWPEAPAVSAPDVRFRMADLSPLPSAPIGLVPIGQRSGVTARWIGDGLYLADPEGRAIHRMNPLSAAIWDILATPMTADEIGEILAEAFPDIERSRLGADLATLLSDLATAGLIG